MKLRIHYLTDIYLGERNAGTTHTLEIVKHLQRENKVDVICPTPTDNIKFDHQCVIHTFGLKGMARMAILNLGFLLLYPFYLLKNRPDVIYQRFDGSLLLAPSVIFSKLFNVRLVMEVNGNLIDEITMRKSPSLYIKLVYLSEKLYYSYAEKIICVTPGLKKLLCERYNLSESKIEVICNGVNIELFKPLKPLKNTAEKQFILFQGSLLNWQGLENLINAVPQIVEKYPNISLLIVGDGPEKDKLITLTNSLNVSEHIIFIPAVPQETLVKLINLADICVAPFIKERNDKIGISPMKIVEYMACGKPIISSRINNLDEIERFNAGVLIDPENPEKLAEAIIRLLEAPEETIKMGENGRHLAECKYSWKHIGGSVAVILRSI